MSSIEGVYQVRLHGNLNDDAKKVGFTRDSATAWVYNNKSVNVVLCCEHNHKHYHAAFACVEGRDPAELVEAALKSPDAVLAHLLHEFLDTDATMRAMCEMPSNPVVH